MMSRVYILIPSHNNKKEVLEILGCLGKQTYDNIKIVLVDDGSSDNTEDEVRKSYPDTIILKGDGNLWWTGATVMGVNYILDKSAADDFILLLNNDLVVQDNYVETLVQASVLHKRAITGSLLMDYHNPDFMEGGVQLDHRLNLTVNRDRTIIEHNEFGLDVDVLPGRGTLVPVEVFNKIGNFNRNKLPHYGADYEFSVRARRAGYKLIVAHHAKVYAKLNITGLVTTNKRFISMRECLTLLVNKKSKTNIYYYLNYVWLCSERKYRVKNLLQTFRGILLETVGKTYPVKIFLTPIIFCVKLLKRMILFVYIFMLKGYPLRRSDIEAQHLVPETLVADRILTEKAFRGQTFYYINSHDIPALHARSAVELAELSRLKRLSFNYRHKIDIILDKINLMAAVRQTDEI